MKKLNIVFLVVALSLPHLVQAAHAAAPAEQKQPKIILNPEKPGPGDIVVVTVQGAGGPIEGKFRGKKLYFNRSKESFKAVLGVDLNTAPGTYPLDISANGKVIHDTVAVQKKHYPLQKLTLPKDMVDLSSENEARVEREQKKLSAIWPNETVREWTGDFINPREGKIVTLFGMRRVINGEPKSSHTGIDIAAEEGQKVRAPNNGIVVLADNEFFTGNSVFLDHGQGIYTMFFHLSKILVHEGQQVKKGDVLGLVGSTGRSTGPHLHWGVRVQGARVNPLELIHLDLE